jgi:hypothetical protein
VGEIHTYELLLNLGYKQNKKHTLSEHKSYNPDKIISPDKKFKNICKKIYERKGEEQCQ